MANLDSIVAMLIEERDKLNRAIEALNGRVQHDGHTRKSAVTVPSKAVPATKKRTLSAAGRKAIAEAARKRWALIRAGKAKAPNAAKKKAA